MVEIEMVSPSAWDPLRIGCEVCWVVRDGKEATGFGVRFDTLSPAQSAALSQFLATIDFPIEPDAPSGGSEAL